MAGLPRCRGCDIHHLRLRRDARIHAEAATFEVRASEVGSPRPGERIMLGGDTFVVQGEPQRRDPDRLVWTVDVRLA
jgi:hypothetical protein